jgi:hypothetical protein
VRSLAGYLQHLAFVVQGGRYRLRALWNTIAAAPEGSQTQGILLAASVLKDLAWWQQACSSAHAPPERPLWPRLSLDNHLDIWHHDWVADPCVVGHLEADLVITYDASSSGYGFYFGSTEAPSYQWAGAWTEEQSHCSSNWRELKCVVIGHEHAVSLLLSAAHERPKRLLSRIDNACAVSYVNKGQGRAAALQSLMSRVHELQMATRVDEIAVHLPAVLNERADGLSRLTEALFIQRTLKASLVHEGDGGQTRVSGYAANVLPREYGGSPHQLPARSPKSAPYNRGRPLGNRPRAAQYQGSSESRASP